MARVIINNNDSSHASLRNSRTSNVSVNSNPSEHININVQSNNPVNFSVTDTNTSRIKITTPVVVGGQDYNNLTGLPSINNVTVKGALTYLDLFLAKESINTKEYWNNHLSYIPEIGEIVIYLDKEIIDGVSYSGIKIGDGNAYLVDLPFVGDDLFQRLSSLISEHINDTSVHVTSEEKSFWNNKLNCTVENGNLHFNRM